jgi:hypothetical protein
MIIKKVGSGILSCGISSPERKLVPENPRQTDFFCKNIQHTVTTFWNYNKRNGSSFLVQL